MLMNTGSEPKRFEPVFGVLIVIALLTILSAKSFVPVVKQGQLFDPDCYMRLVRVEQLAATGDWYDSRVSRSNFPYGETLHWTRAFDLVLLLGAWPLAPLLGFQKALWSWGVVVSPLLGVLSLFGILWATRPVLERNGQRLILVLFLCQPLLLSAFLLGRIDHHSLLVFLFVFLLGCLFRMATAENASHCLLGGVLAALAIWVSVESLIAIVLVTGTLTVLWIIYRESYGLKLFYFYLSLLAASFLLIFVERPLSSLLAAEYDRVSIVHFTIFFIITISSAIISRIKSEKPFCRLVTAGVFFFLGLLFQWSFFPDFFKGPYVKVDPAAAAFWLSGVKEVQPLFSLSMSIKVMVIGPLLLSAVFLFYTARQHNRNTDARLMVPLALGLLLFGGLTFFQIRWVYYSSIIVVMVLALFLCRVLACLESSEKWQALKKVTAICIICTGFIFASHLTARVENKNSGTPYYQLQLKALCEWLAVSGEVRPGSAILANLDFGPEILYRTSGNVIATPYHRNGEGISFYHGVMSAESDNQANLMIEERGIDLVVLCPHYDPKFSFENRSGESTFFERLLLGQIPPWLEPVKLPGGLDQDFMIFKAG